MIWVIARREFSAMFLAPLAWVILAVIQLILGYMFLTNLDNFLLLQPQLQQLENTPGVTDIVVSPLMQVAAIILLMVMPLLTMRTPSKYWKMAAAMVRLAPIARICGSAVNTRNRWCRSNSMIATRISE